MYAKFHLAHNTHLSLYLRRVVGLARYRIVVILLYVIPLRTAYFLARSYGRRKYERRRPHLAQYAANMERRLDASADQVELWLRRYHELSVCENVEAHLYHRLDTAGMERLIVVQGQDRLRNALAKGRGAILYSGHVTGHFTFFAALARMGIPMNMIGFPDDLEQWVASRRNAFLEKELGVRLLRMTKSNFGVAVKAANALRRNEIVTIEIDQVTSNPRVDVEFFGTEAAFPAGAALIAQASGAPMLPFWIYRPADWAPQVAEIGEPQYVEDVDTAIETCARTLELYIRRDPATWLPWTFSRNTVWLARTGSGVVDQPH